MEQRQSTAERTGESPRDRDRGCGTDSHMPKGYLQRGMWDGRISQPCLTMWSSSILAHSDPWAGT